MSEFLDQARHLWEVAGAAAGTGGPDSTHTILIHPETGIRVVSDSDWPLESLKLSHGARTAYRITCDGGSVRVEGRAGSESCLLETDAPRAVARRLLADHPAYWVSPPVQALEA